MNRQEGHTGASISRNRCFHLLFEMSKLYLYSIYADVVFRRIGDI